VTPLSTVHRQLLKQGFRYKQNGESHTYSIESHGARHQLDVRYEHGQPKAFSHEIDGELDDTHTGHPASVVAKIKSGHWRKDDSQHMGFFCPTCRQQDWKTSNVTALHRFDRPAVPGTPGCPTCGQAVESVADALIQQQLLGEHR